MMRLNFTLKNILARSFRAYYKYWGCGWGELSPLFYNILGGLQPLHSPHSCQQSRPGFSRFLAFPADPARFYLAIRDPLKDNLPTKDNIPPN